MAEIALALGFVFAVADDVLALSVAAMKDLDDHDQSLPNGAEQQPSTNHYLGDMDLVWELPTTYLILITYRVALSEKIVQNSGRLSVGRNNPK